MATQTFRERICEMFDIEYIGEQEAIFDLFERCEAVARTWKSQ